MVAGLLPDADALIYSASDPLLQLEYHRHFSHALVFIPFGAALATLLLWPLLRHHIPLGALYRYALLGYGTGGLLDACTSYGTHLLWPFSHQPIILAESGSNRPTLDKSTHFRNTLRGSYWPFITKVHSMKVVVFGAAGWVGRAILENLQGHHEIRAFDMSPESWQKAGPWTGGEIIHGDISDYDTVDHALDGQDAIIHAAVYFGAYDKDDQAPFQINLKGLWNTLEAARHRNINRIVHIGSCQIEHPQGTFFDADIRRPDGSPYAISKRLQEEMCRQFHEAFNQSIAVLRPCSIIDSRLGMAKGGAALQPGSWNTGWVCRHDLAEASRLAIEKDDLGFEVLHMAGAKEADEFCNTQHAREVLGFEFKGDLDQYR